MNYEFHLPSAIDSIPVILAGLPITLGIAVGVFLISLPLAVLVAIARLNGGRVLAGAAYVYTEIFRTVPLLVLLTWFLFVPGMVFGLRLSPFAVALAAFALNTSAFCAEAFRGAVLAVDRGQAEAAMATGMTPAQVYGRVVLPQAFVAAIPILATTWVSLFRDTALVAVVGVHDMMFNARTLAVTNYRPIEVLTTAAIIYFVLTYPQSLLSDWLLRRQEGKR